MLRTALLSTGLILSVAVSASAQLRFVTDSSFYREVIHSERPVLVDFTASWCPPCREMLPRLEQLADEHPAVRVVQVDIDASPRLAERFNVESIPTMILFYRGARVAVSTGAISYARLDRFLHDSIDAALRGASLMSNRSPSASPAQGAIAAALRGLSLPQASRGQAAVDRRTARGAVITG